MEWPSRWIDFPSHSKPPDHREPSTLTTTNKTQVKVTATSFGFSVIYKILEIVKVILEDMATEYYLSELDQCITGLLEV